MKNSLIVGLLAITFLCDAQHFPCDNSRVGKLITRPLLRNGDVHYELANRKVKRAKHVNGVFISKIDSLKQNCLFRIYHFRNGLAVMLEYNYNENYQSCNYFFGVKRKKGQSFQVKINPDGEIEKPDSEDTEKTDAYEKNPFEEYRQEQIDTLMKYLELHYKDPIK